MTIPTEPLMQPAPGQPRTALCREVTLRRNEDLGPVLEEVVAALNALGYCPQDRNAVHIALAEALTNALKHGNGNDPSKRVRCSYLVDAHALVVEVEDEGPGFDPAQVPDPTLPENWERPSGRGLTMMRHYMSWVQILGRGNRLTLCKRASA
jgi:serine/threonine-protein kinase RsbW